METEISMADLDHSIKQVMETGRRGSFKNMCGIPLKDFVLMYHDKFSISNAEGEMFIQKKKSYLNFAEVVKGQKESEEIEGMALETTHPEDNSEWQNVKTKRTGSRKATSGSYSTHTIANKSNTTASNRNSGSPMLPSCKNEQDNLYKPMAREKIRNTSETEILVTKLVNLVERSEGSDLKFVVGHDEYVKNPLTCQKDIISMWNTPHRVRSHIVLGVQPRKTGKPVLKGCDQTFDTTFYDSGNLFRDGIFSVTPIYEYISIFYQSKVYGIIEIGSSFKHGHPSIVKQSIDEGNEKVEANQLWFRDGKTSALCQPIDDHFSMIYQWFLGRGQNEHEHNVTDKLQSSFKFDKVIDDKTDKGMSEKDIGCTDFSQFWTEVSGFKKGHFILFAEDVPNRHKHLENLALVPWIAVYDFDVFSCTEGLFNALQDSSEKLRQLRIATWTEPPLNFSENSTYWCFMRGRREFYETRTDEKDGTIESPHSWYKHVKESIVENCEQIAAFAEDYTVLTFLIMWPMEEQLVPFMKKLIDKMFETVSHEPKLILCLNEKVQKNTEIELKAFVKEYSDYLHVFVLNYSQLCLGIGSKLNSPKDQEFEYVLPKSDSDHLPDSINEKDVMWLKEDLEVLYLRSPYIRMLDDSSAVETEVNNFYKGGTFRWFAWYEFGDSGVDIARDVLKDVEAKIENTIGKHRSAVVTILHAPGSGGSTLAQRVMWNFHTKLPCAQLRGGTLLKSKDLTRKLEFIHDHTQLTTLLLIDGEDDMKVKYLSHSSRNCVILHVKRFPFNMRGVMRPDSNQKGRSDNIFVSGIVSLKEARALAIKFGDRCKNDERHKRLQTLKTDVQKKSKQHSLYEFGMTVYSHEFRGIVSYVRGYLQLSNDKNEDLLPWQRCVGYLSLVYYYGQMSVPCQLFARLFGKSGNYIMSLEDFPYPSTEFIVYDTNDRKRETLRICHFEVAKEILEQLLMRFVKQKDANKERLGRGACSNLANFSKEFIEYCSNKKVKDTKLSQSICFILTKTFIYRDEIDVVRENEEHTRKRPQLSQLLLDIPSGKPLFQERLKILEKLSSSFPDDPNFHAHVGRFYAFCGPDDYEKAEQRFEKAIVLVNKRNKNCKNSADIRDYSKSTLMHVYHMYGVLKKKQISSFTGKSQNDSAKIMSTKELFLDKIQELVIEAERACDFFIKSREMTPENCEQFAVAYLDEINVRLQICDYVVRHYRNSSNANEIIKDFLESEADEDCRQFVEESIYRIEYLLMECYGEVVLDSDALTFLRKSVKWFNAIFKMQALPEASLTGDSEIAKRRLLIATLKLDYGASAQTSGIENVNNADALHKIITLYEENFDDIHRNGDGSISKKDLDYDYREWMMGIRHELFQTQYSLVEVLSHIQKWHGHVHSPMSTFYTFVIKRIVGLGNGETEGRTEALLDVKPLKSELNRKSTLVIRPRYPREWLGNGVGIRALIPGNKKGNGLSSDGRDPENHPDLHVCKGTICYPNTKSYYGQIEFDLKVETLKVHFIPKKAGLEGPRFAGRRVQFNLAFSFENGHEAFHVKLLKRHGCSKCSAKIEFTSSDWELPCLTCGELIDKDTMNEVETDSESGGKESPH